VTILSGWTGGKVQCRRSSAWWGLMAAIAITGCSDPNVGVVRGTVTINGVPPKSGSIAFFPTDGKSRIAGTEIVDGQYTLEVPRGPAKVEVRVPKVVGQKKLYDTPESPVKDLMAESLPPKYNDATELTLDVQPGENRQDYDLTTK